MTKSSDNKPFHALVYLGAGAEPALAECAALAEDVWLVEASPSAVSRLEQLATNLPWLHIRQALIDTESRTSTFHEYNFAWASGSQPPDAAMQRLYPGLRCLHRHELQTTDIRELVRECLESTSSASSAADHNHLLIVDLGEQARVLLEVLEASGDLQAFSRVVVVPGHRRAMLPATPMSLQGPIAPSAGLDWLPPGSQCFQRHPLWDENQRQHSILAEAQQQIRQLNDELTSHKRHSETLAQQHDEQVRMYQIAAQELAQFKQQVEELSRQCDDERHKCEALAKEQETLQQQFAELTQEHDEQKQQSEAIAKESNQLKQQLEECTHQRDEQKKQREALAQERDELWHKSETLTRKRDELQQQVNELASQREDALHQNHLNHEALKQARQRIERLTEERNHLREELQVARQQAERHHQQLQQEQQQRHQLVEQEMLKAEAQLDLVREILTNGKDF